MRAMRVGAVAATVALVAAGAGILAQPVSAAPGDFCNQPQRVSDATPVPWAQAMLGPDRAWSFTRGAGVTVAVLDSGVDARHAQLKNHVLPGFDATLNRGAGNTDCAGTGTMVAGIIAAQTKAGVGFHGIAPGAQVLPIRVYADPQATDQPVPGDTMARAISHAVAAGAKVIDISMLLAGASQAVKDAITAAQDQDVLVIAAIGDTDGSAAANHVTPYPAAYKDVLGVGAIDASGSVWADSRNSQYVDLAAPGVQVAASVLGGGIGVADSTRLAAAFVAGTAALVRARFPQMSAPDVARRLEATAIPAPGGKDSNGYGHGIVNPYGAVTEEVSNTAPRNLAGLAASPADPVQAARQAAWTRSSELAWLITGIALALVVLTLVIAVALPRGRRRRWHAGLAAAPEEHPEDEEPAPPMLLFQDQ